MNHSLTQNLTKTIIQTIKNEIWMKKLLIIQLLHIYPPVKEKKFSIGLGT